MGQRDAETRREYPRPRPRRRGATAALPRLHPLTLALLVGSLVASAILAAVWPATAQQDAEEEVDLYVRGGEVYQSQCAACHGTRAEGGQGEGVLAGPPIDETDINYWDQTVRTGRMPIIEPSVGIRDEMLDEADREALAVYARERFELPGEIPTVTPGDAARGQEIYVRNCAACHGAAGGGGISGANVRVPPLVGLDSIAIVQATRIGPFEMPGFDAAILSDDDIDDMVGYLEAVAEHPRTAAGVREVDQLDAGLFALGLGLLAGVVVLVVARARRWYPHDPEGFHTAPPFEPRS